MSQFQEGWAHSTCDFVCSSRGINYLEAVNLAGDRTDLLVSFIVFAVVFCSFLEWLGKRPD